MKKCSKCEVEKDLACFNKNKRGKLGLSSVCKDCFTQAYYLPNKEKYKKRYKKWKNNNLERCRELGRNFFQKPERKEKHRINQAARRAVKLKATIPGFEKEVADIYLKCPLGYHVDHIVPLRGKTVCGLHVPWNLQYLTPEENRKKNNKLILIKEEK